METSSKHKEAADLSDYRKEWVPMRVPDNVTDFLKESGQVRAGIQEFTDI